MRTADMKSNEEWSSQLWSQFLQLRKEAWKKKKKKKFRTSTGLEPVTSRYRCDALPTELWSHWRWEQVNFGFMCSRERYVSEWCIWTKSYHSRGWLYLLSLFCLYSSGFLNDLGFKAFYSSSCVHSLAELTGLFAFLLRRKRFWWPLWSKLKELSWGHHHCHHRPYSNN